MSAAPNYAYSSDMARWAEQATDSELVRALAKARDDQSSAWSDAARSFPANRERIVGAEMRRRGATDVMRGIL